jgi:hypothetical protein
MNEGQPTHGLPPADWQPPSAHPQRQPAGVAVQGLPYFNLRPYPHPYHTQSPHVAGVTRGLPIWQQSQQTVPSQADVTRRLDEIEERSKEGKKQRLRLEAKVDENAQTLAVILDELKGKIHSSPQALIRLSRLTNLYLSALRSQAVAVAPANLVPAGVSLANAPIALTAPHRENLVSQQHITNRPSTIGDNMAPQRQISPVQNDETEDPNSIAGEMAARVSKRRAQPNQTSSQCEPSKRAKTAHSNPAGADQSNSGSDALLAMEAHSRAVFRLRPRSEQPQQPQQQQQPRQPRQQR